MDSKPRKPELLSKPTIPRRRRALPAAPVNGRRVSPTKRSSQSSAYSPTASLGRPSNDFNDSRKGQVLFSIDAPPTLAPPVVESPMTKLYTSSSMQSPSPTLGTTSPGQFPANRSPDREADKAMETQNVIVAVRSRPLNDKELQYGTKSIVLMQGNTTTIVGPQKDHDFSYDHSFDSSDYGAKDFASQEHIYKKIGVPLLTRALEGYNCCLFAYGQTGSGKSYSMMGEKKDRGIIPRFARHMWEKINDNNKSDFKVEVSYFEIYSEQIFDLLVPPSGTHKNKLKVREHPVMGPYVENLKTYPALNFEDIEGYIATGGKYRATASTNMNATSSRSHAVFTITITQTRVDDDEDHTKVSKVNLIDLAGSERSDRAGTSGQRLREGSAINKSLHTLGKIIAALAMNTKKRKLYVPYRDSVLTWILKESLGGNSKTGMLATLSPCPENYQETLSTLRYAHQARSIVNEAKINEDANIALIRELRSEITNLRSQYGDAKGHVAMAEVEAMRDKLSSSERLMDQINRSWEEKLRNSEKVRLENQRLMEETSKNVHKIDNRLPNLVNLNEDPQLSEMLIYMIKEGNSTVGSEGGSDIELKGVFILGNHAKIHCTPTHEVSLTAIDDALLYVNGVAMDNNATIQLKHADRIIIGNHHFFRLNIPRIRKSMEDTSLTAFEGSIKDYSFAREELERIQTARIEAELELEHQREKEQILQKLEVAQRSAESKLEEQRAQFEQKLSTLAQGQKDIEAAALEQAIHVAQTEERERAIKEITQQRKQLETERDLMEMRMREEKEVSKRQMEDEAAAKNKIINELELEKSKIESDLQSLKQSHQKRRQSQTFGLGYFKDRHGIPNENKKRDWIHISALINEANELSSRLKQNTVFNRADLATDDDDASITLHNTKLGIATTWTLEKFEDRLVQISEIYRQIENGADRALAEDLFYDPHDEWEKDVALSQKGPNFIQSRSRSMYNMGADEGKSGEFMGIMNVIKAEAKARREENKLNTLDRLTGSPTKTIPSHDNNNTTTTNNNNTISAPNPATSNTVSVSIPSVPALCRQYIKNSVNLLQTQPGKDRSSADEIIESASALRNAATALFREFKDHSAGQKRTPLQEQSNVRNASLSAAISAELLCSTIRALRYGPEGKFIGAICESLTSAANATATSLEKLLQGVDNGIESMVIDSHNELLKGITSLANAAGELAIATFKGEDDEFDEPEDDQTDPSEFELDEEESALVSSRMVEMSPTRGDIPLTQRESFKIDDEILQAFEKGTHAHVEKSLANLTHDMDDCTGLISGLIQQLNSGSNVSAAIVFATSNVIKSTRATFLAAQKLQTALLEVSSEGNTRAKLTFYRKSFTRAKGIINEVREVADAINGLVGCTRRAVDGTDDVAQVMSHAKTLRAAIARLTTGADTKLSGGKGSQATLAMTDLSERLRTACNDVKRASKQLTAECEEFNSSDAARMKRSTSISRMPSSPAPMPSPSRSRLASQTLSLGSRGGSVRGSMKRNNNPKSEVQRRAMLVEQQTEVFRLERELMDAQRDVKQLHKSLYKTDSNASTHSNNNDTSTV